MKLKFDKDKFRVLFYKTKLTQAEFGYIIGKSGGAISQYLSGYTKPSAEAVEKMAKALHVEVDDLLTDVEGSQETPPEAEKPTKYTNEEKEAVAFESLMTAIELIKIARDMLKDVRKGERK
jgi:transcriptional regulator with XRE-family HTH domain